MTTKQQHPLHRLTTTTPLLPLAEQNPHAFAQIYGVQSFARVRRRTLNAWRDNYRQRAPSFFHDARVRACVHACGGCGRVSRRLASMRVAYANTGLTCYVSWLAGPENDAIAIFIRRCSTTIFWTKAKQTHSIFSRI